MTRKTGWMMGAFAALLIFGAAVLPTSADAPRAHAIHGEHFFGDGETVDLSELEDGETRFFDAGDRQVIATRYGDTVEMTLEDPDDGDQVIECSVSEDRCIVFLPADGGEARILIMKTRISEAGEGEATFGIFMSEDGFLHEAHEGEHEVQIELQSIQMDGEHTWVSADGNEMAFGDVFVHHVEEGTTLRCPEGDTTMRLGPQEENDGPFYCPKHDIELEKAADRVRVKEIRVQRPHEDR